MLYLLQRSGFPNVLEKNETKVLNLDGKVAQGAHEVVKKF